MILFLAACASGSLVTEQGPEPLRTAFFIDEGQTAQLFVSNGQFDCQLPELDDTDALIATSFAACREGARHAYFRLEQGPSWTIEQALWVAVNEAAITDEDGLNRQLSVTDWDVVWHAEPGGMIDINDSDSAWTGQFDLPEVDVHGRFHATACPVGSELFAWLGEADVVTCP